MQTYARVENGTVMEVFSTDRQMSLLFHPALTWVPVRGQVAVGFVQNGDGFAPPPAPPPAPKPSLAQVQAELAALTAKVAALG